MRIAVAGATGNIGSLTVAALERERPRGGADQPLARRRPHDRRGPRRGPRRRGGGRRRHQRAGRRPRPRPWRTSAGSPATCSRPSTGRRTPPRAALDRRASTGSRATRTTPASGSRSDWSPPDGAVDHRAGHAVPRLRRHGGELDRAGRHRHDRAAARAADRARRCGRASWPRWPWSSRRAGTPTSPAPARRTSSTWPAVRSTPAVRPSSWCPPGRRGCSARRWPGPVLLPGEGARIAPTTFDDWLATAS